LNLQFTFIFSKYSSKTMLAFTVWITLPYRKVEGRNIALPDAQDHKKIWIVFNDGNMATQEDFFKLESARKYTGI